MKSANQRLKHVVNSALVLTGSIAMLAACGSSKKVEDQPVPVAAKATALPKTIDEAVANTDYRTMANRERDRYRHPVETLNFFGLKPEMTVVELTPGSGWYMEILAPLLSERGHYVGGIPKKGLSDYGDKNVAKAEAYVMAHPELREKVSFASFSPPDHIDLGAANSADLVVTFRNIHNWTEDGGAQKVFDAAFSVLKPGGVFGVVEHRAAAKRHKGDGDNGYVSEKDVLAYAKKAGFKLDAKSEINANAKDTKNYPKGVWTLPPSLQLGDKDRDKYVAIGESDRMTLRFVKPAKL